MTDAVHLHTDGKVAKSLLQSPSLKGLMNFLPNLLSFKKMRGPVAAQSPPPLKRGPYPLQVCTIVKNPIEIRFAVNDGTDGWRKSFWRKCQRQHPGNLTTAPAWYGFFPAIKASVHRESTTSIDHGRRFTLMLPGLLKCRHHHHCPAYALECLTFRKSYQIWGSFISNSRVLFRNSKNRKGLWSKSLSILVRFRRFCPFWNQEVWVNK